MDSNDDNTKNQDISSDDKNTKITLIIEDDQRTDKENSNVKPNINDLLKNNNGKIYSSSWSSLNKNNKNNKDNEDNEDNINMEDFESNDTLNMLLTNIVGEIFKNSISNDMKIPELLEIKLENVYDDDDKYSMHRKKNKNKNNNNNNNNENENENENENDKNSEYNLKNIKIDYASMIGDIDYLDKWLLENLDLETNTIKTDREKLEQDYSSDAIDITSSKEKLEILDWWLKVHKDHQVNLKYTKKAINNASKNGNIKSLDWWLNSNLELKYDSDAIDYASNLGKIEVLDWWINNKNKEKVNFLYTSKAIDNCKLDEYKLLKLLKWWKFQKDTNNIEFKYSNIFISYIETWRYKEVYNFLLESKLIEKQVLENINFNKNNGSFINLFDLLGNKKKEVQSSSTRDISNLPEDIQKHIKEKEEELNNNMLINGKAKEYIDNLLKIPFGKYKEEKIFRFINDLIKKINELNVKDTNKFISKYVIYNESDLTYFFDKIKFNMELKYRNYQKLYKKFVDIRIKYMNYVDNILDTTIHGQEPTKKQIKYVLSQWLSGGISKGIVIGIQGPPGVGKTTFIKGALSKCLVDFIEYNLDENNSYIKTVDNNIDYRPFSFISLGGTTNGSTLVGHNITYHGSTPGDIVNKLKEANVMNPILYFDELDKISNTEHGHEISSVLTHITDPSQNEHFTDRYFSEVKIDLSKCLIIFSYNDSSKVDKILLDRIQEICIKSTSLKEKLEISKKFLIPEICKTIGYNNRDIKISDDELKEIILEYTYEAGVRKLKEKLQELIRTSHYDRIITKTNKMQRNIRSDFIKDTFSDYAKVHYKKINSVSKIGYINGMYASESGIGGITVIQVKQMYNKDFLAIHTTGSLKKVMTESIQVARTAAWNLLTPIEQDTIICGSKERGLHIHCPDGATPKDGPSAGTAITCAIYSYLINKPIKNDIAITGEIDLDGNVTIIGGLDAKLNGAKRAGITLVLIPLENERDLNILLRKDSSLIDDTFNVKMISHVTEAIEYIF